MSSPFIYPFATLKEKYFYDVNTNAVVRVSDDLYKCLMRSDDNKCNRQSKDEMEMLRQAGFLRENHWKYIQHPATEILDEYLNSSIEALTLQVTQQCNLRCKYCPYSGSYYNRRHKNANMSVDIAKKAINFYIKHSFDMKELHIGFYGGEPLIQYDLIKELVHYVYEHGEGKKIWFHMTTNATMLDEEKIKFILENNFRLTISLDGPKSIHDKNRKNIDNKGSFDKVVENIQIIKDKYPQYMKNVLFNCVVDRSGDFGCLSNFFSNYEVVKNFSTMFNEIAQEGLIEEKFISDEKYDIAYRYEVFKLLLSKCNLISKDAVSVIVRDYYEHIRASLHIRTTGDLSRDKGHPGGPCIPGVHKLFVSITGDFYPCEKLNECIPELIIGNVFEGFYKERVEKILNIGKLTDIECKNCWCSYFCYQCVLFAEDGNEISAEKRRRGCKGVKKSVESMLRDFCLIKEMEMDNNKIYFL